MVGDRNWDSMKAFFVICAHLPKRNAHAATYTTHTFTSYNPQRIIKMKLTLALVASLVTGSFALQSISEVKAESNFGMDLLSKARRVEEAEVDTTWISGYSLKFQGCHHISQWNAAADGEDDVRIETKRLARFRLCPVDSCSDESGYGCKKGYGDYIVDMDTFLATYLENKEEVEQENCENYAANNCGCGNDGDDDEEACLNTCYSNGGMSYCVEEEEAAQYYNGVEVEQVNLEDYKECAQYGGGRRLEEDGGGDGDGAYYVGPYCANNGGSINFGLFTDDTCTEFADEYGGKETFKSMTGMTLPYSSTSIVDTKCYTCEEVAQNDGDGNNGNYYAETKEACSDMYTLAGKCESYLSSDDNAYPNESSCTYMEGIKITRSNGIIISGNATKNKVASAFIGIFSISFVALGSYVYYLKTKLDRGSINLSD